MTRKRPFGRRIFRFRRLTPRARRAVSYAKLEARRLGSDFVGTEHLLLGLLREGEGNAFRVLAKFGSPDELRNRLEDELGSR